MVWSDIISIAVTAFAAAQAWSTHCVWVRATSRRCAIYLAASTMVLTTEMALWSNHQGKQFAESSGVAWVVHCVGAAVIAFVAVDRNRRFRRSGDAVFIRPPAGAREKSVARSRAA